MCVCGEKKPKSTLANLKIVKKPSPSFLFFYMQHLIIIISFYDYEEKKTAP